MENLGSTQLCPHVIVDDNGVCVDCGVQAETPEFMASIPKDIDLGDVVGICKLAEDTAKGCRAELDSNKDPLHPELGKLRLVGGSLFRITPPMIIRMYANGTFGRAKELGYRGNLEAWEANLIFYLEK